MQIKRKIREPETVTLTCTIASVSGHKPLVGFSDEVEKAWRSLVRKHNLKTKLPREKGGSSDRIIEELEEEKRQLIKAKEQFGLTRSSTGSMSVTNVNLFIHIQKRDEFGYNAQRG